MIAIASGSGLMGAEILSLMNCKAKAALISVAPGSHPL